MSTKTREQTLKPVSRPQTREHQRSEPVSVSAFSLLGKRSRTGDAHGFTAHGFVAGRRSKGEIEKGR